MGERRYKVTTICPHCGYEHEVGDVKLHGEKEQPDGGTPGDPWEEWVERMPMSGDHIAMDSLLEAIKDWLRGCPCRK